MSTAIETQIPVGTYAVDPSHSQVGFRVRHMGLSWAQGQFADFTATVESTDGTLEGLQATATIQVASINTSNTDRDNHLRSGDFFDAATYPALTFTSTEVKVVGDAQFELTGDLTIRDVTQRVTFKAEYLGTDKDPWGNQRVAFSAETKISRKEYGLTWNVVIESGGVLVSDEVRITLDLQFVKQA